MEVRTTGKMSGKAPMTPEQEQAFRRMYPVMMSGDVAEIFGMSRSWVYKKGKAMGIARNREQARHMRSESLKRAWENERKRVKIGLSQRTHFVCPSEPYTPPQQQLRKRCIKRGYVKGDAGEFSGERYTIYYTNETVRSNVFEKHCAKNSIAVKDISERRNRRITNFFNNKQI